MFCPRYIILRSCPSDVKAACYKALVRPQLEYASGIWDPHIQSNIYKIEALQGRAAIFVTGDYRRTSSESSLLDYLGWEDLHTRRQHGKMYRTVNYLVEMPASTILQPVGISRTRGHNHRYLVPNCIVCFLPIRNKAVEQSSYRDTQCLVPKIIQDSDHGLVPINTDKTDVCSQFQMHMTLHPFSCACK